jgi:hypothetical protein
MRTRSPSTAPPVKGLVGSTAMMPTDEPVRRTTVVRPIDQRALPHARCAGDADDVRATRSRVETANELRAAGVVIFDDRDRAGDGACVPREYALENGVGSCHESSWRAITSR